MHGYKIDGKPGTAAAFKQGLIKHKEVKT